MVAYRAAVVALLAFLGAGCCCGPCGPCCGYPPPLYCSSCYQPCCQQYAAPCGSGCSTCASQFGWQQGYGQQQFAGATYQQYVTQANGPIAATPTVANGVGAQPTPDQRLASYSARPTNAQQTAQRTNRAEVGRQEFDDLEQRVNSMQECLNSINRRLCCL
jgi:hypothetical protein